MAHLSPDSPAVDVALTPATAGGPIGDPGPDVARSLAYGDIGGYLDLPAGSYALSVRPAGSSSAAAPALSVRVELPAGGVRTVALSGLFADLALVPLPDDLAPPPPGAALLRVLAGAAGAPDLDVSLDEGGPAPATGLPFSAASGYTAVPAGPATVRLGTGPGATTAPLDLVAGTVVSLLVLDGPDGGLVVRPVLDATAPAVVPAGGVEAGGPAPLLARFPRLAAALAATFPTSGQDPAGSDPDGSAPLRLRAPAAGVDAPLAGTGLDSSGALAVPVDPATAGWYAAGPAPGQPGPAVLAGHVDWAGRPAVFAGLDRLAPGDGIEVDRADGVTVRFVVERVVQVPKGGFPTSEVYGPVPGAELRLITCAGVFDAAGGSYRDNVVVFARAIS